MKPTTHYKKYLKDELDVIVRELQTLGIHNPTVPEDWIATPDESVDAEPDANITADRSEEWQVRRATLATLETRFNNINRALMKIEKGEYGICEVCGNPIEADRLEVNPAARTDKAHLDEETTI